MQLFYPKGHSSITGADMWQETDNAINCHSLPFHFFMSCTLNYNTYKSSFSLKLALTIYQHKYSMKFPLQLTRTIINDNIPVTANFLTTFFTLKKKKKKKTKIIYNIKKKK